MIDYMSRLISKTRLVILIRLKAVSKETSYSKIILENWFVILLTYGAVFENCTFLTYDTVYKQLTYNRFMEKWSWKLDLALVIPMKNFESCLFKLNSSLKIQCNDIVLHTFILNLIIWNQVRFNSVKLTFFKI